MGIHKPVCHLSSSRGLKSHAQVPRINNVPKVVKNATEQHGLFSLSNKFPLRCSSSEEEFL